MVIRGKILEKSVQEVRDEDSKSVLRYGSRWGIGGCGQVSPLVSSLETWLARRAKVEQFVSPKPVLHLATHSPQLPRRLGSIPPCANEERQRKPAEKREEKEAAKSAQVVSRPPYKVMAHRWAHAIFEIAGKWRREEKEGWRKSRRKLSLTKLYWTLSGVLFVWMLHCPKPKSLLTSHILIIAWKTSQIFLLICNPG